MSSFKDLPNFEYHHKKGAKTLDIILQGISAGIDQPFIQKVIETRKKGGNSVLAFNFLFFERGDNHSSGEDLHEELDTLQKMMDFVHAEEFDHVRFVAKSLGGIVASFYLDKNPNPDKYSVVILGYARGYIKLNNFPGQIAIIQGEKDKFGGIDKVKEDMKNAKSKNIKYFEIPGADHSYRNPNTREYEHLDAAMKILSSL